MKAVSRDAYTCINHLYANLYSPYSSAFRVETACREISWCMQAHAGKGGSRAVYIAPKEELAKERFADWTQKFGAAGLGLNICLLTGDPLADYAMLREANIVISTPEHWDMLSRRWRQQSRKEIRNVALFIVDELHLIGGANGPVLEVGCCLSRLPQKATAAHCC